jgi:hypothetical protein
VSGSPGAVPTRSGPGRVILALYAVLTVAAVSRSAVQLATRATEAPLAYGLSALAALVYVAATVALGRGGPVWRRVAVVACSFELAGVLLVGTASVLVRGAFPDATVWSGFGRGYLYVPLVLPVAGLWWLRETRGTRLAPRPAR